MKWLHRHLLALAILTGLFTNPLSADPDASGLSITPDQLTICFTPEIIPSGDLPPTLSFSELPGWSQEWRVSLNTNASRPPSQRAAFEAQWTNEHYENGAQDYDVVMSLGIDLLSTPDNPLNDAERCGRGYLDMPPYSRYGIQIVPCDADTLQLNFSSFPFPRERENTLFAVKLYGAEWACPWDDEPGLHRRSLPNDWVLRGKTSPRELNDIRLTIPESRVFALAIQGPGINSGDLTQYGSITCVYYVPRPNQALPRMGLESTLLGGVLPDKLEFLKQNSGRSLPVLDSLLTALRPPDELCATFQDGAGIRFAEKGTPLRPSWLYRASLEGGYNVPLYYEAVYVHSYHSRTGPGCSPLLANILWDVKEKGEALRQKCSERFNVDALPQDLQNFLFNPNAPFAKLRFQVNMQFYMWNKGRKTQLLRPHYAVANMPFPGGKPTDLVCGRFAMKLYGAEFENKGSESEHLSHFLHELPPGFCLKLVHTHEKDAIKIWDKWHKSWVASPENCQIAGTDNHTVGRSLYSVVMGKCMQYCDDYSDNRPWDKNEVTAIVTLHILLPESTGIEIYETAVGDGPWKNALQITFRNGQQAVMCEGISISDTSESLYSANEMAANGKNLFQEFYDLFQ
jgi:hypothetical protein